MSASLLFLWILVVASLIFTGGFTLVSVRESEKRAAWIAGALTAISTGTFFVSTFLPASTQVFILITVMGILILALVLFLLPVGRVSRLRDVPSQCFDEREITFARARLQPGSENYKAYYAMRPGNEEQDNLFRAQPGLLSPQAKYADPLIFALPEASFTLTEAMHVMVDGASAKSKTQLPVNPARTELVKSIARYFGALEVGITELKPEHIYTHIGRGAGMYGAPVELEHKYAIAFTVEMEAGIISSAPYAPVVMESARQYVEAGRAAVQLAQTVRAWGYPARAHMDGDYRVICPLVARDAGLGEIGRMGLLMTPRLGPRVRIAVVTTDLDLVPDSVESTPSVLDFCTICGKCAENCPPRAISFDERVEIDGAMRWRIDSDKCFRYWTAIGTDCGRCMTVCPYSHLDTIYHNIVRWGNERSGLFRRAALWLDDIFYGKHPPRKEPPEWLSFH